MDIVVWLRSLGLGKYEAAFRENDIDESVLANLTAESPKEIGVVLLVIGQDTSYSLKAIKSASDARHCTQHPFHATKLMKVIRLEWPTWLRTEDYLWATFLHLTASLLARVILDTASILCSHARRTAR
jgi:SAM domain (Sterile alpha motif)